VVSAVAHPHNAGPVRGGIDMLMPSPYDDVWTALNDGVFNAYPAQLETTPAGGGSGFQNKNHSMTIPIGPGTKSTQALVTQNLKRVSILMQNNSTAVSPDAAPTMYFNFGAQAQVGIGIGLAPGVGLVLDQHVQCDSLYVTFGPQVNTGATVVVQGAVLETSTEN
jgi:hypothetical protein